MTPKYLSNLSRKILTLGLGSCLCQEVWSLLFPQFQEAPSSSFTTHLPTGLRRSGCLFRDTNTRATSSVVEGSGSVDPAAEIDIKKSVDLHTRYAAISDSQPKESAADAGERQQHNVHQASQFDEAAAFFASDAATPPHVEPLLQEIAYAAVRNTNVSNDTAIIVDAGCGTGALLPFLVTAGMQFQSYLGCDLSPNMLEGCSNRIAKLSNTSAPVQINEFLAVDNSARLANGDIADLRKRDVLGARASTLQDGTGAWHRAGALAVMFNAVFGNVFDQQMTLSSAAALLAEGGRIIISHPLGRRCVNCLHEADSSRVPHQLPDLEVLQRLIRFLPLEITHVEGTEGENSSQLYLVVLTKTPLAPMRSPMLLRGAVSQGYGRGSRKLGFPTANLPESAFSGALSKLSPGVYSGWAVLESNDGGPFQMVANVGYAPTFEGQENREMIVEAHLMDYSGGDFYGQPLRLMLTAYHRPELKFGSLPELSSTIQKDASDASQALSSAPFLKELAKHPFLRSSIEPQGSGGLEATETYWSTKSLDELLTECQQ